MDDAQFDAVWEKCAELKIPVLIHIAEPSAFFDPWDYHNERWERLVWTLFGQNDRPLHEDVAPASRARNGESEAVAWSKLDPSWTATGTREGGTLVHRVVS